MTQVFDNSRTYVLGDPELEFFGSKQKLGKWRYQKFGPAWIKIGRKILYAGSDLNAWIESNRTDPNHQKIPLIVYQPDRMAKIQSKTHGARPWASFRL